MKKTDIDFYKGRVAALRKEFKTLTEYEAIRLIQEETRNDLLDKWHQDFLKAHVISSLDNTPTALEKIAMLLDERLPHQL